MKIIIIIFLIVLNFNFSKASSVHIEGNTKVKSDKIYFIKDRTGFFNSDGIYLDSITTDDKGNFKIDLHCDKPQIIEFQFHSLRYTFTPLYIIPKDTIKIDFIWDLNGMRYRINILNNNIPNKVFQKFIKKYDECIWNCKKKKVESLDSNSLNDYLQKRSFELNNIIKKLNNENPNNNFLIHELQTRKNNDSLLTLLYFLESKISLRTPDDLECKLNNYISIVNDNKKYINNSNYLQLISKILQIGYILNKKSNGIENNDDHIVKSNFLIKFSKNKFKVKSITFDIAIVSILENLLYEKFTKKIESYVAKKLIMFHRNYYDLNMYKYISKHYNKFKSLSIGSLGKRFPNLCLKDINDNVVCINDYLGKVILIEFWATWCQASLDNLKYLPNIRRAFSGKNVIFINIALEETNKNDLVKIIKESNFLDNDVNLFVKGALQSNLSKMFNISIIGIPHFIIVDRKGIIYSVHESARDKKIIENLNKLAE